MQTTEVTAKERTRRGLRNPERRSDVRLRGAKNLCTRIASVLSIFENNRVKVFVHNDELRMTGFNTVNFAKMMGGDNSMDMKQMTKNYKAMTMKMSKKGPISIGGAKKKSGGVGNAMIAPSKKFLEKNGEADKSDEAGATEETGESPAETPAADFVKCQMCDEKEAPHAATFHCEDCDEDMCDVLARAHQRAKMSKGHVLTPIGAAKPAEAAS